MELPSGGTWTVRRLRGPKIGSVTVAVPRHAIHSTIYPHAVERASNLPSGTVSTDKNLTLNYNVPHAGPGTTVELWAGTGPHRAGGVIIGDGLPPSGAATWKLAGGRQRALLALCDRQSERNPRIDPVLAELGGGRQRLGAADADRRTNLADRPAAQCAKPRAGLHRLERRTERHHLCDHRHTGRRRLAGTRRRTRQSGR